MDIQQLDHEIATAKEALKKLRQYKRLLLKIEAEKAAIAALETQPEEQAPPEASTSPETVPAVQTPIEAQQPTENRQETAAVLPFAPDDLSNLSIRQLKALAKSHKLPRYGSLTKAELIAALSAFPAVA